MIVHIYLVLIVGAITMILPFLLMLNTSLSDGVDDREYTVIPRYLYDDNQLLRKYMVRKYGHQGRRELTTQAMGRLGGLEFSIASQVPDDRLPDFSDQWNSGVLPTMAGDWEDFLRTLPPELTDVFFNFRWKTGMVSRVADMWQDHLKGEFGGDLRAYNQAYGGSAEHWAGGGSEAALSASVLPPTNSRMRGHAFWEVDTSLQRDWNAFKNTLPPRYLRPFMEDVQYRIFLRKQYRDIGSIRRATGQQVDNLMQIRCPLRLPREEPAAATWTKFLRTDCPVYFFELTGDHDASYRSFLSQRFDGDFHAYRDATGVDVQSWESLTLPRRWPHGERQWQLWVEFVDKNIPPGDVRLAGPQARFGQFLRDRYSTIEKLNQAYGTTHTQFTDIPSSDAAYDYYDFMDNKSGIRFDFLTVNYRFVWAVIATQGRVLLNTLILIVGTVACHLIIGPMAAYALSRFRLSYTNQVLLFLLATMAFPGEVAMIPNFLLLKELNLLNTYWALILPGAASGYSIFLLKGFFDSLPEELYEAASMDGASELRMFWQITLPMSKPVLAVIALGSFTSAYGSFMWAFLICQDQDMWTLMVFLFQLGQFSPTGVATAALVMAAIPTLLFFIACQKIIMRGIVIPTMK